LLILQSQKIDKLQNYNYDLESKCLIGILFLHLSLLILHRATYVLTLT